MDHDYQAPYTQDTYRLTAVTATFGYLDSSTTDVHFTATALRIDDYPIDSLFPKGTQAYIWAYSILQPERLTTWTPSGIQVASVLPGQPVESFVSQPGQPIVDVTVNPASTLDFYTTQDSSTIWRLNTANGTSTAFVTTSGQPELIGFGGRSQRLYVSESSGLTAYGARGASVGSVALPEHVDALAVNQATGHVLALSAQSGQLRVFNSRLILLGTVQLPQSVVAGSGNVSIALHDGLVYIHQEGEPVVAIVSLPTKLTATSIPAGVRFVQLAGATASQGLAVDDSGRIFVQNPSGQLAEYLPSGTLLVGSPFAGKPVGPQFVVNTNFTNFGPGSPAVVDYLPPEAQP